jgi:hypothetical protein
MAEFERRLRAQIDDRIAGKTSRKPTSQSSTSTRCR